jgi:prepilin-type processing-associated H-X9-DG protein
MLTFEEAKKIGIRACVDKLGYDFVKKYEATACAAYGDEGDHVSCFVGVSTEPDTPWNGGTLILDDSPSSKYPYSASCNVAYADGSVTFLHCVVPAIA